MLRVLKKIGILNILIISIFFNIISCTSLVYIKPSIPDLTLTEIPAPSIDPNNDIWERDEFVKMVDYSLKLEIQLDAYKKYIKALGES